MRPMGVHGSKARSRPGGVARGSTSIWPHVRSLTRHCYVIVMIVALQFIRRQNRHNRSSHFLFPARIRIGHEIYEILTRIQRSSSSFAHPDILFNNTLSQQERGLMEDITRGPDDPDDPDTLMCSFDDDDASRNAMKKARKYFFPIHPIPRFFVDNAFLLSHKDDHDPSSSTPLPRRVGVVVGLTTALRCAVKRVYVEATRGNRTYMDDEHRGQG